MATINFFDPESGNELTGDVEREGFIGEQRWAMTSVEGIYWAVPQGWPNNASPVCEESEPEAYREISDAIAA